MSWISNPLDYDNKNKNDWNEDEKHKERPVVCNIQTSWVVLLGSLKQKGISLRRKRK